MAVLTPPDDDLRAGEDARGAELARPSGLRPHPTTDEIESGINDAESFANDPANASGTTSRGTHNQDQDATEKSTPSDALAPLQDKTSTAKPGASTGGAAAKLGALARGAGSYVGKNKKGFATGGGIAGVIIGLILSFLLLLPLKLESMMKNFFERRVGSRIERYLERRADSMMGRYLTSSVGTDDVTFERSIVSFGEPLKDLYRTFRVTKFEARLEANQGIRFQRDPAGGITVFRHGQVLGSLDNSEAKTAIRKAVRDETRWFQVYKRAHLRRWMANAYGVKRWKFFDKKSGTDAQAEVDTGLIDTAAEAETALVPGVLDCALENANCLTDEGNPDSVQRRAQLADAKSSATDGAQNSDVRQATTDSLDSAKQQVDTQAKQGKGGITSRLITKIFGEEIAKRFEAIAGPVAAIGLLDTASLIDHFFASGNADKVLINIHKVQYAAAFAQWLTISDNIKDGSSSSDEVNAVMKKLEGTEKSAASVSVYSNGTGGQPLNTTNDGKTGSTRSINEKTAPIKSAYLNDPLFVTIHTFANLWFQSGHQVWQAINGLVGAIAGAIIHAAEAIIPGIKSAIASASGWIISLLTKLIPPAMDGTETGADLMNGLDAGAAVTGMDFARNMGGHTLTLAEANQLDSSIAQEQLATYSRLSLNTKLFSTDYSGSIVNRLALMMPATPAGAVSGTANYIASIASNPTLIFSTIFNHQFAPAQAASSDTGMPDLGLIDWGLTDADLNQPLSNAAMNQAAQAAVTRDPTVKNSDGSINLSKVLPDDCPKVTDGANLCRADIITAQTLKATSDTQDDGGLASGTSSSISTTGPSNGTGPLAPGSLSWPVDIAGSSVVSCYGPRGGQIHPGDDIAKPLNSPVYATKDGTVVFEGAMSGYGPYFVVIDHGGGTYTSYGHMNGANVTKGQVVKQGQQIGIIGNQGESSGPHLHFNLYLGGTSYVNGINGNVEPLKNGLIRPSSVPISGSNCAGL